MTNKLVRLGPTGIEYGDYAWNFYSGCRHKEEGLCPPVPCWAEEFVNRFTKSGVYPNGFAPTVYPEAFLSPLGLPKNGLKARKRGGNARVLVNFLGDLFGDWVDPEQDFTSEFPCVDEDEFDMTLKGIIFDVIRERPDLTFVFCTKNPRGAVKWGKFPDNCEVGFSATNAEEFALRQPDFADVDAKVKWCSIEPLLDWSEGFYAHPNLSWFKFDWVALGGLTGRRSDLARLMPDYPQLRMRQLGAKGNNRVLAPPVAWLKNIIQQCDAAGAKVFIKDNLWGWLTDYDFKHKDDDDHDVFFAEMSTLRQECGARVKFFADGIRLTNSIAHNITIRNNTVITVPAESVEINVHKVGNTFVTNGDAAEVKEYCEDLLPDPSLTIIHDEFHDWQPDPPPDCPSMETCPKVAAVLDKDMAPDQAGEKIRDICARCDRFNR